MSRGKLLFVLVLLLVGVIAYVSLRDRGIGEAVDNVADQVTGAAAVDQSRDTRSQIRQITDDHEKQLQEHLNK